MTIDPNDRLIQHLPAVLQEGEFLPKLLQAFESVLIGNEAPQKPGPQFAGLATTIESIHTYLDANPVREDFLPWIEQWVGVANHDGWTKELRVAFVQNAVPLYKRRGTRLGIEKLLQLFVTTQTVTDVKVVELSGDDENSRHCFSVEVVIMSRQFDEVGLARAVRQIRATVERAKPAHTCYLLKLKCPALRLSNNPKNLGVRIGKTTTLGTVDVDWKK